MTCTAAELSAKVQIRIPGSRLIQLSNYDSTATSVNTSVLEASCEDSIGHFRQMSGLEPDKDNYSHIAILVRGVAFFLESYKGRDAAIIANLQKDFVKDCISLRDRIYGGIKSSSTLAPSTEATNAKPDFDRSSKIWPQNRHGSAASSIKEISE